MLHLLATAVALQPATPPAQCNGTSTYCPAGVSCCASQYSPTKQGCQLSPTSCCKPGPPLPPSPTLKNVLIIGDSVSIGYTSYASPNVPELLSDVALAQHGPWDVSDGGAGTTGNGVACLDNWLVTQAQAPVTWDLITFNFGLHDLDNATAAESEYMEQLVNITTRLQATGAKLLYITTTPYMPLRLLNNTVVEDLNAIANVVMAARGVPVLDLYTLVTDHCGAVPYEDCDWCRKHPCSYHYNPQGETPQAAYIAGTIRTMLAEPPRVIK